ncbi:Ribosomal_S3_C domain-containing protein, partial [Cephalotus follicularis]
LQINIQKKLNCVNQKLNIAITRIAKPYGHPNIIAEFITGQLKNRVSFRKVMKKAIELTEQANTKGIQIQIAGRIDGKEIEQIEWIREGRVPLQTIRAKIRFGFQKTQMRKEVEYQEIQIHKENNNPNLRVAYTTKY